MLDLKKYRRTGGRERLYDFSPPWGGNLSFPLEKMASMQLSVIEKKQIAQLSLGDPDFKLLYSHNKTLIFFSRHYRTKSCQTSAGRFKRRYSYAQVLSVRFVLSYDGTLQYMDNLFIHKSIACNGFLITLQVELFYDQG